MVLADLAACLLPAGPADTGELTDATVRDDARLERRVSVRSERWYYGALCEPLTELTGVEISANERDGVADPRLISVFRDARMVEVLHSMRSLVS